MDALLAVGFRFIRFSELEAGRGTPERLLLLRHDVDASMEFALSMARIEHRMGIRSTYFVMLRSPLYNLMGRHGSWCLRELVQLGHEIGLHFDASCECGPRWSLGDWVRFELSMLGGLVGREVTAMSLHQPTPNVIEARLTVPGVVNTYHPEHMAGFHYLSDSNRDWRGRDPLCVASSHQRLQLLLHPMWWMCDGSIDDCWNTALRHGFENAQNQLLATERAYGGMRTMSLAPAETPANSMAANGARRDLAGDER